jgi:hypothetical protein
MKLKEGDEFLAEHLGEGTIILKKINLRALLEDAIEKAKSVDLNKLERDIEEESDHLPARSSRYLLDNTVFIAAAHIPQVRHKKCHYFSCYRFHTLKYNTLIINKI